MENQNEIIKFTPEKSKQISLARLDLIEKWLEFRKKSTNKLQADYDFAQLHNSGNTNLFTALGKISRGTLHRWHSQLNGTSECKVDFIGIRPGEKLHEKFISKPEAQTSIEINDRFVILPQAQLKQVGDLWPNSKNVTLDFNYDSDNANFKMDNDDLTKLINEG